ncbi:MAG TPA: transporter [Cyclobacteriaceae bacterium]|nr:transporter [Cyclobacteriaceae bacterium]
MNPVVLLLFFLALTAVLSANGQQEAHFEPLSIDRPDVSNLPTTVLPRQFQFELGTEWAKGPLTKEFYMPNVVMRTGLSKKVELRLGFNQLFLDSLGTGLSDDVLFFSIGAKYRFVDEDGLRPSIAIQPEFALPFGDGAYIHHDYPNYSLADYSLIFLFNNTLHKKVFINYNAGVFWSRKSRVDYLLSASASFLHTRRLGYYFEGYTLVEERYTLPLSLDAGLMFLFMPRIQFDAYAGNRGVDGERFWFWGAGIGFRIDPGDMAPKDFHKTGVTH